MYPECISQPQLSLSPIGPANTETEGFDSKLMGNTSWKNRVPVPIGLRQTLIFASEILSDPDQWVEWDSISGEWNWIPDLGGEGR